FAADMLNAAYTGASPLANAVYFSANTASGRFCLVGLIDTNMDCAETAPISGYPQYFLYKMLVGPGYLDMANGGFMAVSRVPGTAQAGTDVTAFYTANMDSILIVNPTATTLLSVPINLSNSGAVSASGTMYLLNSTNQNITAQPITFSTNGAALQTTVNIPAYSVIGISLPVTGNTVTVAVTPNNVQVGTGQIQQFGASVNGSTNQAVTWSVDGISGGNATVGTIDSFGQYVAPSQTGSHTVAATSVSNPSASGSANVTVVVFQGVKLTVSPTSAALFTGAQQQFTATITGTSNTSVIWAVDGINGGNSTVGTVSSSGLYTAPASAGTHSVRATSAADASALATASVTISSGITANFGGRAGGAAIPSGLFGAQLGVFQNQNAMQSLLNAGFGEIRLDIRLETIYANSTPNWTALDAQLTNLQTAGMHPLLEVDFTPASLQPATTPCATGVPTYHAAPPDPAQWGQLAASVVAHVDQAFPGLAQDYEIWNEPDTQSGLCVAANTDAARQSAYISMFDAAASAMHQQASTDGVTIRIGGPALGNPVGELSSWIPALLGDATAAANIDFVSYHFFPSNQSAVNAGMNWNSSTATTPLYQRTQDASSGVAAVFTKASSLVKAGKQPNPSTTPILITDYNDGNGATVDCCRNDPTYGPLWNSLVLVDLLNTPYAGAQAVPNRLIYDAASLPSAAMCLLGNIDANFDCAYTTGTNPSPYPQYYSYLLFGSSQYLGLASGGNLATSVSTSAQGVLATGFYTSSGDVIVLVNPTGTDAAQVPIQVDNGGFTTNVQATMFLLNQANGQISSQPLTLNVSGSSYSVTVAVP